MGVTSPHEVLLAPLEQTLSEFMHEHIIMADVMEDQREVAQKIAKYNQLALPVTEEGKKLKGVITWMMQWASYCPRHGNAP